MMKGAYPCKHLAPAGTPVGLIADDLIWFGDDFIEDELSFDDFFITDNKKEECD